MTEKKTDSPFLDKILEGVTGFSLRRVLDDIERRLKAKSRKFAARIILTLAGLYLMLIAVVFISLSLVRILSSMLGPAYSWGLVGLFLGLFGAILIILGRLVTQ